MPPRPGPRTTSPTTATALSGGAHGPHRLRPLLHTVLDALTQGATTRDGPIPPGGPDAVTHHVRTHCAPLIPTTGTGAEHALHTLVHTLAHGAADPAHPHCAAHLHCPPLALAAAADLAASALNPSLDSWDQAPAATALETQLTTELAALLYPHHPTPDAIPTTGGTESNHLALLLAREHAHTHHPGRPLHVIHGANAHHSIPRAAWLLGLPQPTTLPTPHGVLDPTAVHHALQTDPTTPALVVATAGTTDTGAIDPLTAIADVTSGHHARLHTDAAYAGPLLLSPHHAPKLHGITRAATITLDLHKLGWQPAPAGFLAVPDTTHLHPLRHQADYLNATDDTRAGIPDLLGRSLHTTRRADILKTAVTLKALGRDGLATLLDTVCDHAQHLADLVQQHPTLELHAHPTITTVLLRPTGATDHHVATTRRTLLHTGRAVLGRAHADGRLWLKATLLNPHTTADDLRTLLDHVTDAAAQAPPMEGTTA